MSWLQFGAAGSVEDRSWGLTSPLQLCATHSARCRHCSWPHRPTGESYSGRVFILPHISPLSKLKPRKRSLAHSINGDLVACLAVPAGFFQRLRSVLFLLLRGKRPCPLAALLLLLTPRLLQTLNSVPPSPLPWPLCQAFANPQMLCHKNHSLDSSAGQGGGKRETRCWLGNWYLGGQ